MGERVGREMERHEKDRETINEIEKDVYYRGSKTQWNGIRIEGENTSLSTAAIHYYCIPDAYSRGDTDGNGATEPADARLALRISLGLLTDGNTMMTVKNEAASDANGNGEIEPADARLILRRSLGLTDTEWSD